MSDVVYSHAGVKIEVSTLPQNEDLTEAEYEALSYVQVSNVGALGEYGISTNIISYDTTNTVVTRKAKGISDAGNPTIECARSDSDAGQDLLIFAGVPNRYDAYAFKITKQDGAIDYMRGLVSGPVSPSGRNEDFDIYVFTMALLQKPQHVSSGGGGGGEWLFATGVLTADGVITSDGIIPA